jgi:hypothetical protein
MKRELLAASVIAALSFTAAQGAECKDARFPEEIEVEGTNLLLNGLGLSRESVFKVSVYVAALYLDRPSHDPREILASNGRYELVLQFLRKVDAKDVRKRWEAGFARNFPEQLPVLRDRISMLNGWVADMKPGQRMTFDRIPGTGIRFDVNGTVVGTIEGDDFATAFLEIWLGDAPTSPDVKGGLLGGACG